MPKPITDLIRGTITLDPADAEVLEILSIVCITCGPIAHALRRGGYDIKTRAENEQGAVLLWMLSLYRDHGKAWRDEGQKLLNAMFEEWKAAQPAPAKA